MLRAIPGLSSLGFTSKSIIQVLQFIPRLQRRNQSYKEVNHLPKPMNAKGELEYRPRLVPLLSQYLSVISVVSATDFQEAQRELGKYADALSLSLAYDISLGSEAWEGGCAFSQAPEGVVVCSEALEVFHVVENGRKAQFWGDSLIHSSLSITRNLKVEASFRKIIFVSIVACPGWPSGIGVFWFILGGQGTVVPDLWQNSLLGRGWGMHMAHSPFFFLRQPWPLCLMIHILSWIRPLQVNCRTASASTTVVCVTCLSGFRAWWRLLWQVDGARCHVLSGGAFLGLVADAKEVKRSATQSVVDFLFCFKVEQLLQWLLNLSICQSHLERKWNTNARLSLRVSASVNWELAMSVWHDTAPICHIDGASLGTRF